MTQAESQKNKCQANLRANEEKIKYYEELYDSLNQFKGVVSDSQGQFSTVNSAKKNLISDLESVSLECRTAKTYSEGMNKVLNGIGVAYVNCTFSALLFSINLKLTEYKGRIQALEASNRLLNIQIRTLSDQIRKEATEARQEGW